MPQSDHPYCHEQSLLHLPGSKLERPQHQSWSCRISNQEVATVVSPEDVEDSAQPHELEETPEATSLPANAIHRPDSSVEVNGIAPIPHAPSNYGKNLSFVIILARHKPSQQLSVIHRLNRDILVKPTQGQPNTSYFLACPYSVNCILRKLTTQVTGVRFRDVLVMQIHLCWQRLITRPPNKIFDFQTKTFE